MFSIRCLSFACWIVHLFLTNFLFASTPPKSGKICIAVLFNSTKSNVTGADRYVGVFVRERNETEWQSISNTNLFSFGISFSQHGVTQRYYIAGGNGLHRSSDGGKTWKILTSWQTMEVLSVALDPVDSTMIYVATPYGIFKSTDDGKSWNENGGAASNKFQYLSDWHRRSRRARDLG
jgi:photosystem II stability/assembly factor-like uncharacterized protein